MFQVWLIWSFVSRRYTSEEAAMTRRFLFPLAASVVGLVAISPVLAAERSTPAAYGTPPKGPAKATTTTTMADDPPAAPGDDSGAPPDDPGAGEGSARSTA